MSDTTNNLLDSFNNTDSFRNKIPQLCSLRRAAADFSLSEIIFISGTKTDKVTGNILSKL